MKIGIRVFLDIKPAGSGYKASWYERGVPYPFYTGRSYPSTAAAATVARRYLAKHNALPEDAFVYKESKWPHTVYVDTTANPERFAESAAS